MGNALVVESDPQSRELISRFLREEGHCAQTFADGATALTTIQRPDMPIDLAVIAWDLAGPISGSEFLARLIQQKVAFPRVVVSSLVNMEICSRAFALRATDLVLKPLDGDRFRASVRKALKDPKEVDPLVAELRRQMVGEAPVFLEAVVRLAEAIRQSEAVVLLVGETGVGKELFAKLIHQKSRPDNTPFVPRNLAGIPSELFESELFGHLKGSFTGAHADKEGAFETVGEGTLFLDEIGHLDFRLQPKLLRAIQEQEFLRVGGTEEIPFRARLVCATSLNLARAAQAGTFLDELYYRISQFEIRVPPLRERKEDVPALVSHFLREKDVRLERETMAILDSYSWPGNVRELENLVNQTAKACKARVILPGDLPTAIMSEREKPATPEEPQRPWPEAILQLDYREAMQEVENRFLREYLPRRLGEAGDNREKAAEQMGITPKTLRQKLKDCGLGHFVGRDEGETA